MCHYTAKITSLIPHQPCHVIDIGNEQLTSSFALLMPEQHSVTSPVDGLSFYKAAAIIQITSPVHYRVAL